MTPYTKEEFDAELTKFIQATDLDPRDFVEVFVFALARIVYCVNHATVKPMTPDEYIVPILGTTLAVAVLEKIRFLEACQIAEREKGTVQ